MGYGFRQRAESDLAGAFSAKADQIMHSGRCDYQQHQSHLPNNTAALYPNE
jgi:hypothetical protein